MHKKQTYSLARITRSFVVASVFTWPLAALAAPARNFSDLVNKALAIIDPLILILFTLTFLYVVWGVIDAWIIRGDSDGGVADGKQIIFNGLLGLAVMASVWGLVRLLQSSFLGI